MDRIYGYSIKDICSEEILNVFTIFVLFNLELQDHRLTTHDSAIRHGERPQGVDFTDLYNKVKEQLPNFNKEGA